MAKNNEQRSIFTQPHQRLASYLLLASLLLLTACKEPLFTKLKEEHANEMMSILLRSGIDADKTIDKKDQTQSILISKSDIPAALSTLKQFGYPRESYKKMIDVFDKEGLISSPLEERVRYIYALTQEVQETLSQIDGVITARVHVVLPKNDPFGETITPSSASIFIKYLPSSNLKDIQSDIKLIVEKSIEGLKYEKISISMIPSMEAINLTSNMQWKNILGVRVPQDSVGSFRLILGVLLFSLLVAVAAIVFLLNRLGGLSKLLANDEEQADIVLDKNTQSWNEKIKQSIPSRRQKEK